MTALLATGVGEPIDVDIDGLRPRMLTAVEIDLNVRVRGNETFAGFEDADGSLGVGDQVEVYEPESGLVGTGRITEIDAVKALVYLSVDWSSLQAGTPVRKQPKPQDEHWQMVLHAAVDLRFPPGLSFGGNTYLILDEDAARAQIRHDHLGWNKIVGLPYGADEAH